MLPLAGESTPCYKVAAETGGQTVEGYLSAGSMEGLDDFERGRRDAAWLDTPQIIKEIHSAAQSTAAAKASAANTSSGNAGCNRCVARANRSGPGRAAHRAEPAGGRAGPARTRNPHAERSDFCWRSPASPRGGRMTAGARSSICTARSTCNRTPAWNRCIAASNAKPRATKAPTSSTTAFAWCCATRIRLYPRKRPAKW